MKSVVSSVLLIVTLLVLAACAQPSIGAGSGDAGEALAALTFYKRFVLAPRYGQPLPAVDWSAGSSTVLAAVEQVEDEPLRELLAKELQSRRAQANSLADVKARAEHMATMRTTAEEVARSLDP